jgi:membrane protease YdiL (CAAX protease family)
MASGKLGEVNNQIRHRPEVKILVYFALTLALAVLPYMYVVNHAHWIKTSIYATVQEGIWAAAAVGAVFLMRKAPGALPLNAHGVRWRGIVTQTAIGAGIGLAVMSAIMNILRLGGHYIIDRENLGFSPAIPLTLYLFVAIFEETVFRGFLFVTLEQKWGTFVGLTATSLVFGLAHLVDAVPGVDFAHHLKDALFLALEAGVLLNAAFVLTRSLWLGIGIHWAWNFFEGPFYGTIVSGMSEPTSLYVAHTSGRAILTGGGFGPEGGVVCLAVGTVAGLYMLRLAIRAGQWRANPEIKSEASAEII